MDEYCQDVDYATPEPDNKRRKLNKTDKLAAVICSMTRLDELSGMLIPVINPVWAKTVTAAEIVAKFERWHRWDHTNPLGLSGTNHPANLTPLPRQFHEAVKTPVDLAAIAKAKRIAAEQAEFRRKMLAKAGVDVEPAKASKGGGPKLKGRGFQSGGPKAKIKSAGFRGSRKFDGTINWKGRE